MGTETLLTVVVCLALIVGSVWAGNRVVQRGIPAKGATGTLGSVLSMVEPATGAPTRMEAAAAIEEIRQRRHEKLSAGPGTAGDGLFLGKVVLPPSNIKGDGSGAGDVKI